MMVHLKWMLGVRCGGRSRCLSEDAEVARSSPHCLLHGRVQRDSEAYCPRTPGTMVQMLIRAADVALRVIE